VPPRKPPADPARFDEAVAYFRSLVPLSSDEYRAIEARSRRRAFGVTGLQNLDIVHDVWRALDKAIEKGTTLEEFKRDVGDAIEQEWGRADSARLETVFRQNVQTAYSAGRYVQQTAPAIARRRPYLRFVALLDDRTTKFICRPLNGMVAAVDDPRWQRYYPPLHFRCRSITQSLTAAQAEALGGAVEEPNVGVPEGFGGPPTEDFSPNLADYPRALVKVYRAKRD